MGPLMQGNRQEMIGKWTPPLGHNNVTHCDKTKGGHSRWEDHEITGESISWGHAVHVFFEVLNFSQG